MSVCTPAMNAVDRLLELLDQLEQVIVELRRQALDEDRSEISREDRRR